MSKLLSINSYHYRRGGSDVVYLEHDAMFRAAGWQTAVMSMHHPRNLPSKWSRFFVDELEFGHSYTPLQKLKMASKVVYSFEAKRKIQGLLDEFSADVAHLHCVYHHIGPVVLPVLKSRGIVTVMTAHDLKLACPAYRMRNANGICEQCKDGRISHVVRNRCIHGSLAASALVWLESTVHRQMGLYRDYLDKIVVPSLFFRNKLMEWGWPASTIEYIPNFVDSDLHRPRFEAGSYFLYFGRLVEEKGLTTLVAAALAAGVELRLIGNGPMEDELRHLAASSSRIQLLGYMSGEELWAQVRGSRAVVLASEWYENAPMSVLEAFANGKPVVGANIAGIPELIEEGRTGWLFESANVEQLAERLRAVEALADDDIRPMGMAARQFVELNFSRRRYLDSMRTLYARLQGGPVQCLEVPQ